MFQEKRVNTVAKGRILVADAIHDDAVEKLQKAGFDLALQTDITAIQLVETIGEDGILIDQNDEKWKEKFVQQTIRLSRSPQLRSRLAKSGRQKALSQTWAERAKTWEDYLKSL